ncbi:MAG TPA: LexA family transcriptional regulator [Cyclobacteriaceae bacterium]|jgi:transcriptional regulator with XRE-family HTH domain|nr:LexA family transcriptional regulator [Cyclobacteriaceae bacterium]
MEIVNRNIRYLREQSGWTQKELAEKLEVKPPVIGSYEEFRCVPPLQMTIKIAEVFNMDLDSLIRVDLAKGKKNKTSNDRYKRGNGVLAITVDSQNKENVEFVTKKASAGYLNGFSDAEFVKELPKLNLPFLSSSTTYRAFEIAGDSMLPVPSKSIVIGEYVADLSDIKDGETYIIITKEEGIVYKRVYNFLKESNGILLVSDNPLYKPYFIHFNDVLEVWKKVKIILDNVESATSISGDQMASFFLNFHHELNRKK